MTRTSPRPLRIGAVSYLNSKPLIEDLPTRVPEAELILDYPSRLADDLAAGQLDVALIPSVEILRDTRYEIVSDACVASRGPVLSVKLYSRVPPNRIRTLALDEGSRTSAALARILLAECHGTEPALQPLPLGRSIEAVQTEAVLVIGDRAMHPPTGEFAVTWDLGEEWSRWTGLPFVFALWAARTGAELGPVEDALIEARNRGTQNLERIARREAPRLEIPERTALNYLTRNLHYRMGPAERRGLERFRKLACRYKLIPEEGDLVFRNCIAAG